MARFTSSTFGKISGKHGTAIAAVRKDGLCILKEYRIAGNPNTVGQKNQRGKFGFVMKQLNCMRPVFTVTFGGQYGINKAVASAMKVAVSGEFPDFEMDYSKLVISTGGLMGVAQPYLKHINPTCIKIGWNTETLTESSLSDYINLLILNPVTKMAIHKQQIALRSDESLEIQLPDSWSVNELHCWLYLTSPNGTSFSTSQYISENDSLFP